MKIRFGVIGLGNRGSKFALHSILTNPELQLIAVCDPDPKKFALFPNEDITKYTDYMELLANKQIDAVFIATPDDTHGEIIFQAVDYDKHIICEKPVEVTPEKVREVEKKLKNYPRIFLVGYVLRYAPLFYKAKQLLSQGIIGDIILGNAIDHIQYGGYAFFHDWHREKKHSGSLLLQKGTHSLDIINWMIDSSPISVAGTGGLEVFGTKGAKRKFGKSVDKELVCNNCPYRFECEESLYNLKKHKGINWQENWPDSCVFSEKVDVDDHQALLIKYANNATMTYSLCQFAAFYRREYQFFGTKGELYFDDERNEIIVSDRLKNEQMRYQFGEVTGHGGGDDELLLDFIDCVQTGKTPRANLESSIMVSQLAFSADQAILENKFIQIKI